MGVDAPTHTIFLIKDARGYLIALGSAWDRWKYFNRNTHQLLIASAFVGLTFEGTIIVLYNRYVLRLDYGPYF